MSPGTKQTAVALRRFAESAPNQALFLMLLTPSGKDLIMSEDISHAYADTCFRVKHLVEQEGTDHAIAWEQAIREIR